MVDPYETTFPETFMLRELEVVYKGQPVLYQRLGSSRDVDAFMRKKKLHLKTCEFFIAILLDSKHRPMGWSTIAQGGLNACPVKPNDLFKVAIRAMAAGLVVVHNHPSGCPTPSPEDITLTERICRAGELLGVPVLDHVIVGATEYFSFLDAGLIQTHFEHGMDGEQ